MKLHVYAEEMEHFDHPTRVEKVSNGVRYYGLHFGLSRSGEVDGFTLWFTSPNKMAEVMFRASAIASGHTL